MKIDEGRREVYSGVGTVNGRPLDPRLDLWNHSPTGFEWGYAGSAPAQLALAVLADHLANESETLALYQIFKRTVVANLPYGGWRLTSDEVQQALQSLTG